jgi:hypothetical protein
VVEGKGTSVVDEDVCTKAASSYMGESHGPGAKPKGAPLSVAGIAKTLGELGPDSKLDT